MRKRPVPSLSRSALLCAALALGPGCKSMDAQPLPSSGTPDTAPDAGTASAPGRAGPRAAHRRRPHLGGAARVVTYAVDPWDGALNGLAHEARFQTLSDVLYRAPRRGKREPVDGTRLMGWGTWAPGAKP